MCCVAVHFIHFMHKMIRYELILFLCCSNFYCYVLLYILLLVLLCLACFITFYRMVSFIVVEYSTLESLCLFR